MSKLLYPEDLFPIGRVLKPKGLKGEVKVFLYNLDSNIVSKKINFWIKNSNNFDAYIIEKNNKSSRYYLLKFKNINNRDEAQYICDKKVYISRKDLPDRKGSYLVDLIGFLVKDKTNISYGKVIDIINLPTNNSLLIKYSNKEIMIPIIDDFIELFDYDDEVVIIKNSNIFIEEC